MSNADFYVMENDGSLEWFGSLNTAGSVYALPKALFIQESDITFIEEVNQYLYENKGIIKDIGNEWPWNWEDSRFTDYSYIYDKNSGQVLMSMDGQRPVDTIKILQGMDMIGADVGMGEITFPTMKE